MMLDSPSLEIPESKWNIRKKWWIAAILSLVLPGLGQIYNRQLVKGLLFFSLGWITWIISLFLMCEIFSAPYNVIIATLFYLGIIIIIVFDAVVNSRRIQAHPEVKSKITWLLYGLSMVLFSILAVPVIESQFFDILNNPSDAMNPALLKGDRIVVDKFVYKLRDPAREEIVVFKFPLNRRQSYVKRVVGIPGDTLEMKDKQLIVNGRPVEVEHIVNLDSAMIPGRDEFGRVIVPRDRYFVLGDNRDNSYDSRFWGFVERDDIRSKVRTVWFSWDSNKKVIRFDRFGLRMPS